MDEFVDEAGCTHEGGCGWNPNGVWCGECNRSGVGCPNLGSTNKEEEQ